MAAGQTLPVPDQAAIALDGHAVEARICAENVSRGFLPAAGTLRRMRLPSGADGGGGGGGIHHGPRIAPSLVVSHQLLHQVGLCRFHGCAAVLEQERAWVVDLVFFSVGWLSQLVGWLVGWITHRPLC